MIDLKVYLVEFDAILYSHLNSVLQFHQFHPKVEQFDLLQPQIVAILEAGQKSPYFIDPTVDRMELKPAHLRWNCPRAILALVLRPKLMNYLRLSILIPTSNWSTKPCTPRTPTSPPSLGPPPPESRVARRSSPTWSP